MQKNSTENLKRSFENQLLAGRCSYLAKVRLAFVTTLILEKVQMSTAPILVIDHLCHGPLDNYGGFHVVIQG